MAERVKRRVAAARLAVAFVAAGTIAGATAWASAGPPPPSARKAGGEPIGAGKPFKITSANIENGSLFYKDFAKGQIPSFKMFEKLNDSFFKYKKADIHFKYDVKGRLGDVNGDLNTIKGELGSYVKTSEGDARYIKMNDAIMGDGSVFTATKVLSGPGQDPVPFLSVPNMVSVDILPAEQQIRITNTGGGDLNYSQCGGLASGGTMKPSESVGCATGEHTDVMQLIGGAGGSDVATLNFTSLPADQAGARNYIIAILVGM